MYGMHHLSKTPQLKLVLRASDAFRGRKASYELRAILSLAR
jgi:hypothetical protein